MLSYVVISYHGKIFFDSLFYHSCTTMYFSIIISDVFHWNCLNTYCRQMPGYTAPAGYTCPTCSYCIFPPSNLSSPIGEALRAQLGQVNWARAGLGLPLVSKHSCIFNHTFPNFPVPMTIYYFRCV